MSWELALATAVKWSAWTHQRYRVTGYRRMNGRWRYMIAAVDAGLAYRVDR